MEKPTGLLKKIIENLHLINNVEGDYSPIEKDIILQHLRSVYMVVLNSPDNDDRTRSSLSFGNNDNSDNEEKEKTLNEKIKLEQERDELLANIEDQNQQIEALKKMIEQLKNEGEENQNIVNQQKNEIETLQREIEELKIAVQVTSTVAIEKTDDLPEISPVEEPESSIDEEPEIPADEEPEISLQDELELTVAPIPPQVADDILEFIPIEKQPQPVTLNFPPVEESEISKPVKKSLNDLLTENKEDNSLGTKLQHSKIEDLSKAISINDKFLFIKELFNNKGEEFSAAVQKLNDCNTIEEAFELMEMLKKHYYWDTTAAAYLALCDLVRRKYA